MELKYFNKRRISNIIASVVILWTLYIWSDIIMSILNNSFDSTGNTELLLTMISVLSAGSGYCFKHLMDRDCNDD